MNKNTFMLALSALLLCACTEKEAEPADPIVPIVLAEGPLITGRVLDTGGEPVAHAVVTDGFTQSETDAEGNFRIESPYPERVRFVSVRIPSGYSPLVKEGRAVFFADLAEYAGKERQAEILLEKAENSSDSFTLLMMADPQASVYNAASASANIAYADKDVWEDLFSDLKRKAASVSSPCYGLCLGDIAAWSQSASHSSPSVFPHWCVGLSSVGIPFFEVIGNHDHTFSGSETDDDSAAAFEDAFGPRNYSFDLGQVHFVVLDNCIYKKDYRTYPMLYGLEAEFLDWLKGDLARVPKDMPVMVCTHANVFGENGVQNWIFDGLPGTYKLDEFLEALQGFEKLYVWAGHLHVGTFIGRIDSADNPSGVETFVLARTTGGFGNDYVSADGTPRGYLVLEVSGKDIRWKFHPLEVDTAPFRGLKAPAYKWKPAQMDESMQLRAYPRGAYGDDFVYANVFLWDKHWQAPVLRIGSASYPMTRDYCYDLGYKEIISTYQEQGWDVNYMGSGREHSFYVRVPDGASGTASVEVTDRFGQTWSQEVSVNPIQYSDALLHLDFDFRTAPDGLPTAVGTDISFSARASSSVSYPFSLSRGCYVPAGEEEGHILISGQGTSLLLPTIPGFKLVKITLRPVGNSLSSKSAVIQNASGTTVTGGEKLPFYGNTTDSWLLQGTGESDACRIVITSSSFPVGEIRLAYQRVSGIGAPGTTDDYAVDNDLLF